jgi:hypothetical protein
MRKLSGSFKFAIWSQQMAKLVVTKKYLRPTVCVKIILVDVVPNRYEVEMENENLTKFWNDIENTTLGVYDSLKDAQDNFDKHVKEAMLQLP